MFDTIFICITSGAMCVFYQTDSTLFGFVLSYVLPSIGGASLSSF